MTTYNVPQQDTSAAVAAAVNSLNIPKVREIKDSKKIAAILLETNIVELQRHLLTITVQNQVSHLMQRGEFNTQTQSKRDNGFTMTEYPQ